MAATPEHISFDEFDEIHFPRPEAPEFNLIADHLMSRRSFLSTAMFGTSALVLGAAGLTPGTARAASRLSFKSVAANTLDTVTVPEGFNWHVVASWGDELWSDGKGFDPATRGTGASQERALGDNNDGMELFTYQGRQLLAVNNEYVNRSIMFGNRASKLPENDDDVRKGKAAHGITVVELKQQDARWEIIKDSEFNRRITADSPMDITGPARGHDLLKTIADPEGVISLGTWANCGSGRTPWGTYLTCEENFNVYFSSSDATLELTREQKRYGIGHKDWGYNWASADERFDIAKHPNEPHRVGYIVEIDPLDPTSTPKKRTALGRMKHENAEVVLAADGRVVVYLGDDERGEYLYRFISAGKYRVGGDNASLLEDGDLYAAKFDEKKRGRWVKLTPEATGMSKAEICIMTREAASRVGATTMDRPEWVAANPLRVEAYCSLTNDSSRGLKPNLGGDATPIGGPNPRAANKYGQIVRWRPDQSDHGADEFDWDLFVVGGNPAVHNNAYAGSNNLNLDNMFNSPDGLAFDRNGILWIQTDGNYSNQGDFAGMGNNQMLLADSASGEIKRFMVGPRECEITGLCWSADYKTAFVGIQHPGERGGSNFPGGGTTVPRSSIIAVRRDDGGLIG